MVRYLILAYHSLPALFYVASSVMFYKISHIPMTFGLWKWTWGLLTMTCILLTATRVFNLFDVLHPDPTDWLIPYQTSLVILASLLMYVASVCCWRIFRDQAPRCEKGILPHAGLD